MRIAYLDCSTGISGDMTLAALIDVGVDPAPIRQAIASLGLKGVTLETSSVIRGGFRATYVQVKHPEQHAHRTLRDIRQLIRAASGLSASQKTLALDIFEAIGQAEAHVHGMSLEAVHFHEVGAIDSIVDIVGAAVAFDLLDADRIVCSRVPTGHGHVRIAHGVCALPAPATAELLVGIPLIDVPVNFELTTPTGAAILKTVVHSFGRLPDLTIDTIGYGAGTRELDDRPNVLRVILGTQAESEDSDTSVVLETNLDDVSGEIIGYTRQKLLTAGALDVFTTPIQMKKDRPGSLLTVLCHPADYERLEAIVFAETATFGVRRYTVERSKRARREHRVTTPWGVVRGKLGWRPTGDTVFTPEFEECAKLAAKHNLPVREIFRAAEAAFLPPAPVAPSPDPVDRRDHDHDHRHDHDHDHDHGHSHDHDHGHDHD